MELLSYYSCKLNEDSKISATTAQNYAYDLHLYNNYLLRIHNKEVNLQYLDTEFTTQFLSYSEKTLDYSPASLYRISLALNKLNKYLLEDKIIDNSNRINYKKKANSIKSSSLSKDVIEFIMYYIRKMGNAQHAAITSMLINTGIKQNDLIEIKVDDVILINKTCKIFLNERILTLGVKTSQDILRYVESGSQGTEYLFEGERGKFTYTGIFKILKKYGDSMDVKINSRILNNSFKSSLEKIFPSLYADILKYITGGKLSKKKEKVIKHIIHEAYCKVEL